MGYAARWKSDELPKFFQSGFRIVDQNFVAQRINGQRTVLLPVLHQAIMAFEKVSYVGEIIGETVM